MIEMLTVLLRLSWDLQRICTFGKIFEFTWSAHGGCAIARNYVSISWKQQDNTGMKIPAWVVPKVIWWFKSTKPQRLEGSWVIQPVDVHAGGALFSISWALGKCVSQAPKHSGKSSCLFPHFEVITWCLVHYFCWQLTHKATQGTHRAQHSAVGLFICITLLSKPTLLLYLRQFTLMSRIKYQELKERNSTASSGLDLRGSAITCSSLYLKVHLQTEVTVSLEERTWCNSYISWQQPWPENKDRGLLLRYLIFDFRSWDQDQTQTSDQGAEVFYSLQSEKTTI